MGVHGGKSRGGGGPAFWTKYRGCTLICVVLNFYLQVFFLENSPEGVLCHTPYPLLLCTSKSLKQKANS
jgi:hypothetical protein